jgi:hypothetical protein
MPARDEVGRRTVAEGARVLVINGVFGVSLQQASDIVILSTLLQHHLLDHLRFTTLGNAPCTRDRFLAGRA